MTTDNRTNEPSHNRITIQGFRDGEVSVIREDRVRAIACTLDELKRAVATYEARGALEDAGRPAGTFTEAQVEAAAKALYCMVRGVEIQDFEWPKWVDADNYRAEARAALVAAQGAAPQVGRRPKRLLNQLNRIADALEEYEFDGVAADAPAWMRKAAEYIESERQWRAPVLPSRTVGEDALAEVIGKARTTSVRDNDGVKSVVMESNEQIARAVIASRAEWFKEQGR